MKNWYFKLLELIKENHVRIYSNLIWKRKTSTLTVLSLFFPKNIFTSRSWMSFISKNCETSNVCKNIKKFFLCN